MKPAAAAALALALACAGCSRPITLLTYNTFNLFDAVSSGGEYREYDPARGTWNAAAYERKLAAVASVIRRSCPGGPDIVALQELENREVLDALCARHLRGYRYRAMQGGDAAGVRCGVASRLPIRRVATWDPGEWAGIRLRPVLEMEVDCHGAPLLLVVVHWKAKTGGASETRTARDAAAGTVARRLRELLAQRPDRDVVVAGDFNLNVEELAAGAGRRRAAPAAPAEARLVAVDSPGAAGVDGGVVSLYDAWHDLPPRLRGSSVYRGAWQTPDHLLLSAGLFDGTGLRYRSGSFHVVRPSFLLDPRTGFPVRDRVSGWRYSDHLPLLAELERAPAR